MGLHSNGKLPALPANIRLGWKCMTVTNNLAYHETVRIIAIKSFKVTAPGAICYITFFFVSGKEAK